MKSATQVALDIESVTAASFVNFDGQVSGVVFDSDSGVEFDVRKLSNGRWNVNDDASRNFTSWTLKGALKKAIRTQKEAQHG